MQAHDVHRAGIDDRGNRQAVQIERVGGSTILLEDRRPACQQVDVFFDDRRPGQTGVIRRGNRPRHGANRPEPVVQSHVVHIVEDVNKVNRVALRTPLEDSLLGDLGDKSPPEESLRGRITQPLDATICLKRGP